MGLAGAFSITVGLKCGRNQATITGPEECLQIVVFHKCFPDGARLFDRTG